MAKRRNANSDWNDLAPEERAIIFRIMKERKAELRKQRGAKRGRLPKFDYDSDEWYSAISRLAVQGFTDEQIAYLLEDELGVSLTPTNLASMINGTYRNWPKEKRQSRSEKLREVLARARSRVNAIVLGRYLKVAVGGFTLHNKSVVTRTVDVDGMPTEVVQTTETESEMPPNLQALSTWLYHHLPEWRRVQKGEEPNNTTEEPQKGVSIERWIEQECGIGITEG